MSHVVDVMFPQEVNSDDPRTRTDHFVDPAAVLDALHALILRHDDFSLFPDRLLVSTHPHDQIHVLVHLLRLF